MESPRNNTLLLENFVNLPHYLLGHRLQPFCLLHCLWLEHLGSPFILTSNPITLADVEIAACVCSSSSSEEILRKLSAKNGGLIGRIARWCNRNADLPAACKSFLEYQDDYCSLPEFASQSGERNEKIPHILLQGLALIKETGWSEETVFTMPLGKVIWFNAGLGYLTSGDTSIVSDKERLAMAALDELERLTHGA